MFDLWSEILTVVWVKGALQPKGLLLLRPLKISQHEATLDSTDIDAVEIQKKLEIQAVLDKLYITLLHTICC